VVLRRLEEPRCAGGGGAAGLGAMGIAGVPTCCTFPSNIGL